jgi:RES domain-containing protein
VLVYRITHKDHSHSLFAPGIPGRWNGAGRKVIYAAESIPLAFMENMIRRKGLGFNDEFRVMIIEIPNDIKTEEIGVLRLKKGWRDFVDYSICQEIGDAWYDAGKSAVLKVPSAVLPTNHNFVINAMHKDFALIKLVGTTTLIPDDRIEDILKKYKT